MIDNYVDRIRAILRENMEEVEENALFTFKRLGEGLGYTSLLWSVVVGEKQYAVKITDLGPRLEEATKIYGEDQEKIDAHLALFAGQHNRELQAYQQLEALRATASLTKVPRFFGGVECSRESVGIIIMEDLSATAVAPEQSREGLPLETILSTIDGIAEYHAAYLSMDLSDKGVLFVLGSAGVIRCIEQTDKRGFLTEKWKRALLAWSTPEELRKMQYDREEGEPPLVLGHTDMWTNNIVFERPTSSSRPESGALQLLAFVDWQCATAGLAMLDVASVVGMNMSATSRRTSEQQILNHYLHKINDQKKNFVKEFSAEFDSVQHLYHRCLRFAALQLCLRVGYNAVIVEGDSDEAKEKKNIVDLAGERLRGILEDIV